MDAASHASKKAPLGLFCQPDCTAGRCCSNPPAFVSFTFAQKKSSRVSLHKSFFHGRGWISRAALLKTARWAVFAPFSAPSPQLFKSTLGALCKVSVKQKLQHHEDTGVLGGRGWIRTTEAESSRFTVCPHWPLGNTPIFNCRASVPDDSFILA